VLVGFSYVCGAVNCVRVGEGGEDVRMRVCELSDWHGGEEMHLLVWSAVN